MINQEQRRLLKNFGVTLGVIGLSYGIGYGAGELVEHLKNYPIPELKEQIALTSRTVGFLGSIWYLGSRWS